MKPPILNSSGIYRIRNINNNKFYMGSTTNFYKRWSTHISKLRRNVHENRYLQNAWNKHKEENFIFEIVEETSLDKLLVKEQEYFNEYCQKQLYNISIQAKAPMLGRKHSEETKLRISFATKGNKNPMYGKKHSKEMIEKLTKINRLKTGKRKLTWDLVREIRKEFQDKKISYRILSLRYKVNYETIRAVIKNISWIENLDGGGGHSEE